MTGHGQFCRYGYGDPLHPTKIADLDPGIRDYVAKLNELGLETYESCQGGFGHAYPEPAVRFYGGNGEGYRGLSYALMLGMPVKALRRAWSIEDGVPVGPYWELTFRESS